MKTIEMEIAVMQYFGVRQNIIVPNVYCSINGLYYECDLVRLTNSNYATEIEIKVLKSDLKKDKEKWHNHRSNLFKYLYFAVPVELSEFALSEIPEKAGLLSIEKRKIQYSWERLPFAYKVNEIKKPKKNKLSRQWSDEERYKLLRLGTMRILGLKEKIIKYKIGL